MLLTLSFIKRDSKDMKCDYVESCGGCKYNLSYDEQFDLKIFQNKELFSEFRIDSFDTFKSPPYFFRNRAEFRIFHQDGKIFYAMNSNEKKILPINECLIVNKTIFNIMPKLKDEIEKHTILKEKLFAIEFLSSNINDLSVTLIYHKKLDNSWEDYAKKIEQKLNISIIGRSRKQKIVLSKDYINEELNIKANNLEFNIKYKFFEGGFTQPNGFVNKKMIEWVLKNSKKTNFLVELYSGAGNFTLPLSKKFNNIIATEISKTSIKAAKENLKLNSIENIKFVRMSSEEFSEALKGVREFRRLKEQKITLFTLSFQLSTIFVDPPRAGLDEITLQIIKNFYQIIYISCNPITLKRDLKELVKTHKIIKFAFFDQFPYTSHIESGVILDRLN